MLFRTKAFMKGVSVYNVLKQVKIEGTVMKKKPLHIVAELPLILAMSSLLTIIISPSVPIVIRIIAISVGIATIIILGIIYYMMRRENHRGE